MSFGLFGEQCFIKGICWNKAKLRELLNREPSTVLCCSKALQRDFCAMLLSAITQNGRLSQLHPPSWNLKPYILTSQGPKHQRPKSSPKPKTPTNPEALTALTLTYTPEAQRKPARRQPFRACATPLALRTRWTIVWSTHQYLESQGCIRVYYTGSQTSIQFRLQPRERKLPIHPRHNPQP